MKPTPSADPIIVASVREMQDLSLRARREGKKIAFVPTMGYLHEGHASLLREGRRNCDILVLSIFVNPTQFGAGEDFESYPRDLERDAAVARSTGVDVIFAPSAAEMYPCGYQTFVDVEKLTLPLCGASRPGHFRGVTTVVSKLFNIVLPHLALFGRKDYQQLAVIRRMTADLNLPVQVVGMPIVREPDGLAMSSRNKYLSRQERERALCLVEGIRAARGMFRSGVTAPRELSAEVSRIVVQAGGEIDYIELLGGDDLLPVEKAGPGTLLALAARIGKTRLIDNCILGEEE